MSRYCSYLSTSALQYCASLDCATAATGSESSTIAAMAFREVFMIFSIARSSSDEEMDAEVGLGTTFALRRPDNAKCLRRYNRCQPGVIKPGVIICARSVPCRVDDAAVLGQNEGQSVGIEAVARDAIG